MLVTHGTRKNEKEKDRKRNVFPFLEDAEILIVSAL